MASLWLEATYLLVSLVLQGTGHCAMTRVDRDRDLLLSYLDDVIPGGSENHEFRLLNKQILKKKTNWWKC